MKRLIKFGSIGLVIAGAIAITGEAKAIPSVFLQETDSGERLGVSGTPLSTKVVTLSGANVTKTSTVRVNACGFTKIANPSALTEGTINILGNGSFNVASVKGSPAIVEPTCSSTGVAANLPATAGAYNVGSGAIVVTGLPVSRVLDSSYTSTALITKSLTLNACGFAFTAFPFGALASVDGSTPISIGGLPLARYSCVSGALFGKLASGANRVPIIPLPDVSRDATNNLVIKAAADTRISVAFSGASFTKSATSDRCSGLYLPATTTGVITVNGVSIDTSTFPVRSGQETCRVDAQDGLYYNSLGSHNSRYSDGRIYIKNFSGLTLGDRSIVSVQTTGIRTVSPTTDGCGLSVIRSTSTAPIAGSASFTYGGNPYTVSALPVLGGLPKCNGAFRVLTVPTN